MKIGAMVESFRLPFVQAIERAKALGCEGVQMYATGDQTTWSDAKIKETLDIVKSNGLVFSAICGDFGHDYSKADSNPEYIEKSKRVIDFAKKLECNVVTTHVGHIPEEETKEKEIMRLACRELAVYADSIGSAFALETGTEKSFVLRGFLDSLGAMGVRVNMDPANLVMCAGDNPVEACKNLGKYIVHTHAKDGVMDLSAKWGWVELPLGQGGVNFDTYLPALKENGFDGFLTIERECGDTPEKDIAMAADFLREKLAKHGL